MNANFKMKLITATLMMFGSVYAQASLSALSVNSNLGEPFSGSVVVSGPSAQEILANKSAVSVDDGRIQVSVVAQGKNAVVRFRSKAPINDPILNLRLKASSESRNYTAFLDPKNSKSGKASGNEAQNERGSKARPGSHVVAPNQTIHDIARMYQPKGMSLQQTTNALVRANPKAFKNGNPDTVFAGARLTIPSASQMRSLSAPVRATTTKVPNPATEEKINKETSTTAPAEVTTPAAPDTKDIDKSETPKAVIASEKELPKEAIGSEAPIDGIGSEEIASDDTAASEAEAAAAAEKAARLLKLKAEQEAAEQARLAEEEFDWITYAPFIGGGVVLLLLVAILLRRRKNAGHDDFDDDDDLPPTPKPSKAKKAAPVSVDDFDEEVVEKPVKKGLFSGLSLSRKKKNLEEDDDLDLAIDDETFADISFETPVVTPEQKAAQKQAESSAQTAVVDKTSASAHDLGALLKVNQSSEKTAKVEETLDLPSFDDLADFAMPANTDAKPVVTAPAVQQPGVVLDDLDLDLDALDFGGLSTPTPVAAMQTAPAVSTKTLDIDAMDLDLGSLSSPEPALVKAAAIATPTSKQGVDGMDVDLAALDFGGLSNPVPTPAKVVPVAVQANKLGVDGMDLNLDTLDFDGLNKPVVTPTKAAPVSSAMASNQLPGDDLDALDFNGFTAPAAPEVVKKTSAFAKIGQDTEYKLDFDDSLSFDLNDLHLGENLAAPEVVEPIFVDERPKENALAPSPLFDTEPLVKPAKDSAISFDLDAFEVDAGVVSNHKDVLAFDLPVDNDNIVQSAPAPQEVAPIINTNDDLAFDLPTEVVSEPVVAPVSIESSVQPVVNHGDLAFDLPTEVVPESAVALVSIEPSVQPIGNHDDLDFDVSEHFTLSDVQPVEPVSAAIEPVKAAATTNDDDFAFDDFNLDQAFTEQVDAPTMATKAVVEPVAVLDDFDLALDANLDESKSDIVEEVSPEILQESNAIALAAKLDLVETYLEMGDNEGAQEALQEILDDAKDAKIIAKAKALQSRLG